MASKNDLRRLLRAAARELNAARQIPESVWERSDVSAIRHYAGGSLLSFTRVHRAGRDQLAAQVGPALVAEYLTVANILAARRAIKHGKRGIVPCPPWADDGILSRGLEPMIAV